MSKSAMKKAAKQALKPKKEKDPNWWVGHYNKFPSNALLRRCG